MTEHGRAALDDGLKRWMGSWDVTMICVEWVVAPADDPGAWFVINVRYPCFWPEDADAIAADMEQRMIARALDELGPFRAGMTRSGPTWWCDRPTASDADKIVID